MKTERASSLCLLPGVMMGLMLLVVGCSDQPKDHWYQESVDSRADRDAYIQSQVEAGVDPQQARQTYDLNVMTLNTEGKDPAAARSDASSP